MQCSKIPTCSWSRPWCCSSITYMGPCGKLQACSWPEALLKVGIPLWDVERGLGASKPCLCMHALTLPSVCMGVTHVVTGTGSIVQQPAASVLWVQHYTHTMVIQCDGPSAPSMPCFSHPWLPWCVPFWGIGIKKEPKTGIIRVFFHQR